MHVVFLTHEYPITGNSFGGIGTFTYSLSNLLINKNHSVTIIGASNRQFVNQVNGARIIYFEKTNYKFFNWLFLLIKKSLIIRRVHNENKIDIIESQEGGLSLLWFPWGVTKIIRLHGGHYFFHKFENKKLNIYKAILEKISFCRADGLIATSEFVRNETQKHLRFGNKPVSIINNPILVDKFYIHDKTKVKKNSILFAGTLCEKKGIRQLILALPKILEVFPEIHLFVYGRDSKTENGKSYKKWLIDQLTPELLIHITFYNPVPYETLPSVYESAEICIFPSHIEVQGLVAPEAMCMEKVVIFTEYGPGKETIDHGLNGFLCQPREINSIAETVILALNNRSNFEMIGKNARVKVFSKFHPQLIYEKNIEFYSKFK